MNAFFEGLFTRMPGWFFGTISIIVIIGFIVATYWLVLGTRNFSKSMKKEKLLYDLQEKVHILESKNEYNENVALKLLTVIDNSRIFINSIEDIGFNGQNINMHIQRVVEGLAADVKTRTGEKHRCGFWLTANNEQDLKLICGSSGFPNHYIGNRILSINNSIAGRCFRKKTIINCEDVNDDHDYDASDSNYISLICVPVGNIGVLTIDGQDTFDKVAESVAELYVSILEAMIHHITLYYTFVDYENFLYERVYCIYVFDSET